MIKLKGEVEIIGKEDGKVIYYDKGENLVTYWARHAVMHLLTGDTFASLGGMRSTENTNHTTSVNSDGTLLSGQQYFHDDGGTPSYDTDFFWNTSTLTGKNYPFMPTKMLFGTGYEYTNYSNFGNASDVVDEWASSDFDTLVSDTNNIYSNILIDSNTDPDQARTVNSSLSEQKTEPVISQGDFAISGAVKNGLYEDIATKDGYTISDPEYGRILKPNYRGIGKPCFIYPLRGANTFESEGAQVKLTEEPVEGENIESKITLTTVMPEQTGDNDDSFYPYNGYTIKEAGLFCDSKLFINDDSATVDQRMPYGLMFAKRYITPFTKTANSSYTIRWTIYI